MRPLSRRRALQLGGLGVAGIVVGGTGIALAGTTRYTPIPGETLTQPTVLASASGSLDIRLEAAVSCGPLAGRQATTMRYNSGVPDPPCTCSPTTTSASTWSTTLTSRPTCTPTACRSPHRATATTRS
jgi:hypothetical protein